MSKLSIVAVLVAWAGLAAAGELKVKLTVRDTAKLARKGEVVTTGVPFARGVLKDVSKLNVSVGGRKVPAQFTKTVPWPDGSVRWALMDTQVSVPAGGSVDLVVSDGGAGPAPAKAVKVDNGAESIVVSTGPLEFTVSKKKFSLFSSLKVDGKELLTGKGAGLVLVTAGGADSAATAPTDVKLEQAGPMKAIVRLHGKFGSVHRGMLEYTVRITAYAGQKYLKVHIWLENQGAYGYNRRTEWYNFDGLRLGLGLDLGKGISASCEGASARDKFKVLQHSGGQHRFADLAYRITSGAKELKKGARTDGVVALSGPGGKLNVAIRHFWQNYEKAIELDGQSLKVWLWPNEGEWPRQGVKRGRSKGEFGRFRKAGLYAIPGGVHKGHEAILDFSGRPADASSATLSKPLMAVAKAAYYASTLAAPGWFAPPEVTSGDAAHDARLKSWNQMARNCVDPKHPGGLVAASRGRGERYGFWWGWMDFGDLYWANGACCLHYDWTWIMLLNYLRFGDQAFLEMGTGMARHRAEVDQVWTDRAWAGFKGLTHYERNSTDTHGDVDEGHSKPNSSHHWACGLVLYYMLTGEEKARECALRSAMGVKLRNVDVYAKTPGTGHQLRSVTWGILLLCSVYDLTGEKKYLDQALINWNNNAKLRWKKNSDPTMGGKNYVQYLYSIYPLCVLQDRSGNKEILQCLKEACDKGIDNPHPVESNHFSNLYGYVGWKTKNEAFMKKARTAFNRSIPKGSPSVITGSTAWTKEGAKKLRYGHLLQWIHWQKKSKGK